MRLSHEPHLPSREIETRFKTSEDVDMTVRIDFMNCGPYSVDDRQSSRVFCFVWNNPIHKLLNFLVKPEKDKKTSQTILVGALGNDVCEPYGSGCHWYLGDVPRGGHCLARLMLVLLGRPIVPTAI